MTLELYEKQETQAAHKALEVLATSLPEPFLVMGGWAVYLSVNKSFQEEYGSSYLGSRDVDVGFHIDPTMSVKELKRCTMARAINVVKEAGYVPMGSFRYCKFIHKETNQVLTEEEAKGVASYNLFYLYLDMLVDRIHPEHSKAFKSKALDEPVLARVFDEKSGISVNIGKGKIMMPPPGMLLASKLRSLPNRQKEDKTIKDACDIYAIIWHSAVKYDKIISHVQTEYRPDCNSALNAITPDVAQRAATHLGIDVDRYLGVVELLRVK